MALLSHSEPEHFTQQTIWLIEVLSRKLTNSRCMYSKLGFLGGSAGKESTYNAGDLGSIPGLGRSPGEGKGYPLQYSGLENSTDCIVHGVAKELDTTEQLSYSKLTL